MGCTEVKVEESLFVGWYRFCFIILARSLISLSLSPSHSSRTHSLSHLSEWIEQIKILDNALLPNNNKKNEVEDEAAPNTGSLSLFQSLLLLLLRRFLPLIVLLLLPTRSPARISVFSLLLVHSLLVLEINLTKKTQLDMVTLNPI